jgi:hypothetical protein
LRQTLAAGDEAGARVAARADDAEIALEGADSAAALLGAAVSADGGAKRARREGGELQEAAGQEAGAAAGVPDASEIALE